ncbi:MAG: ABC transporter permease [Armatimonadetes bacterium]|nr:ABC transporter permease [Armatimonadota bacterium]
MTAYIIRRLLQTVPALLGIVLVTFFLVRLTGDPARLVLGEGATEQAVLALRQSLGLNDPVLTQFLRFLGGVLRGDFGTSIRYREPVLGLFWERVPATLELGLAAYLLAVSAGITVGVYSALRWNTTQDRLIRLLVLVGQAVPGFYLGLLAIILFGVHWRLLPTGGRGTPAHLVLPAATLALFLAALIVRFTRSMVLDVLRADYVRTARAKGLPPRTVITRHLLRNALIPLITVLAAQTSVLFSGAVVTETVFAWPGIGRFAVQAISTRDFPLIQATVLILTSVVLLLNLLVDVAYVWLDPRITYQ